ncbi:MAG: hypothetical protein J0I25_01935, partial [Sphingomonadales bacterium]|nr:hypothetical protein [Sphingomonadales bacterium]
SGLNQVRGSSPSRITTLLLRILRANAVDAASLRRILAPSGGLRQACNTHFVVIDRKKSAFAEM